MARRSGKPAAKIFFLCAVNVVRHTIESLPGLHRCHTEETRPWDRYRAAGPPSLVHHICRLGFYFQPGGLFSFGRFVVRRERLALAVVFQQKAALEHACAQKMLAEHLHFAGSHKHHWPSGCTRPRRAATRAPVVHFPSARSDREAVRAEIQGVLPSVFRASTMPPGRDRIEVASSRSGRSRLCHGSPDKDGSKRTRTVGHLIGIRAIANDIAQVVNLVVFGSGVQASSSASRLAWMSDRISTAQGALQSLNEINGTNECINIYGDVDLRSILAPNVPEQFPAKPQRRPDAHLFPR